MCTELQLIERKARQDKKARDAAISRTVTLPVDLSARKRALDAFESIRDNKLMESLQ